MTMKKMPLFLSIVFILSLASCATSGLRSFGAEMGVQDNPLGFLPGQEPIRIPYTSTVKYFGYVEPGQEADEVINGKKVYYLYVWIPLVAPEIGVRMFSPVADYAAPEEGDIVAKNYISSIENDPESYFDTWISFERALSIINPVDIESKIETTDWLKYASNDDSSEMPKQPSGSSYNSLMRLMGTEEPLIRGLYRVGFTTYKVGEVKGSFYAEVGSPIDLPGVAIAKTADEIIELISK
jgi:hypothetical protein